MRSTLVTLRGVLLAWTSGLAGCGEGGPGPREAETPHAPEAAASVAVEVPAAEAESAVPEPGESDPHEKSQAVKGLYLELDSGRVNGLEAGPQSGRLVLLLHGARYEAATWRKLGTLEILGRAGYRAVAIDWPGYGTTPPGRRFTPGVLLAEVIAALGESPALLVAPSMSGRFAFDLIKRDPRPLAGFLPIAPMGVESLERVPEAHFSTLILWGEADEVVPFSRSTTLEKLLPKAYVETIRNGSHACYLDDPERFHDLLLRFAELAFAADR